MMVDTRITFYFEQINQRIINLFELVAFVCRKELENFLKKDEPNLIKIKQKILEKIYFNIYLEEFMRQNPHSLYVLAYFLKYLLDREIKKENLLDMEIEELKNLEDYEIDKLVDEINEFFQRLRKKFLSKTFEKYLKTLISDVTKIANYMTKKAFLNRDEMERLSNILKQLHEIQNSVFIKRISKI